MDVKTTTRRHGWWLVVGAGLLGLLVVWLEGTRAASARPARGGAAGVDTTVTDTTETNTPEANTTGANTTGADTTVTPWHEDAWSPITRVRGVRFDYIFYSKADNYHNGVVLRLRNTNAHPVRLDFTVVFRTPKEEATAEWAGALQPGETQTGENDGLFWIPFKDGQSIGEVGLRGIDVRGE
jgi:hypothetical protein